MTAFLIRVRRISRVPLRLGTTNITNTGDGSVVDANDPIVKRDMGFYASRFVVLGGAEAGTQAFVETMSPNDAVSEITNATGVILFTGIELPKDFLVSSLTYITGATAANTPTAGFVGVYSSDGTTLTRRGVSADSTSTALGANASVNDALTTAYRTTAAGVHFLARLSVATTSPTLVGQKPFNSVVANVDAAKIYATLAAQATLPATQAISGLTAANGIPYVKLG